MFKKIFITEQMAWMLFEKMPRPADYEIETTQRIEDGNKDSEEIDRGERWNAEAKSI